MLAALLNVFSDPATQAVWAFSHQDAHRKIQNAIYQKDRVFLPDYILDPMPPVNDGSSMGVWAYQHQAAHSDYEGILNIQGQDLTDVDFNQPDQVYAWIRIHFDSHYQAQLLTGYAD